MKLLQFIFVNIFLLLGLAITSASTDSGETQTTVLSTSMKVIYATKTSGREVKMETREVKKPESAGHDKILIKTLAAGINRLDLIMKKRFATSNKDSMVLGLEVSGTVESIGHGCVNQFGLKVGDNVMALLSDGGYAEYVQADEGLVMPIPASIDPLEAAAIPEVWLTAYQLLFWIGGMDFPSTQSMLAAMRKEENQKSVLVHAAGSGVGIAATQLASYAGAKVFATAGTDEKLDTVQSYGAFEGTFITSRIHEWMIVMQLWIVYCGRIPTC